MARLALHAVPALSVFAVVVIAACSGGSSGDGSSGGGGGTDGGPTVGNQDGGADASADGGEVCGRNSSPCPAGQACDGPPDCQSGICTANVCGTPAPTATDGTKDGDETDVDCGGTGAPACDDGKHCAMGSDCKDQICNGGVCAVPSHNDGVKNDGETGVDCGGTAPTKCPTGQGCAGDGDCNNIRCNTTTHVCNAPAHDDGLQNGDETGVDCGGGAPNKCGPGQGCVATTDCNNVLCDVGNTNKCLDPSPSDGLKNGNETDVDCGGGAPENAPACATGQTCVNHSDCQSSGCAYNNKCADAPSCTAHEGGDTCGKGEDTEATAVHESCCASVPLPSNPAVYIGKYEITAGRMRQFIARTAGNVRAYIDANPTSQIRDQDKDYLPEAADLPVRSFSHCDEAGQNCVTENVNFGTSEHLGNYVFLPDRPCANCGQGCFVGTIANGAYGHPTYWMPHAIQNQFTAVDREFGQTTLDEKSLNCVTQLLLAAFCKWDGGRLPTLAELGTTNNSAWGPSTYPWGASPSPNGTETATDPGRIAYPYEAANSYFFVPMTDPNTADINFSAVLYNTTNFNPFRNDTGQMQPMANLRYTWPQRPFATWDHTDQAYVVAAPGRMVNDRRSTGADTLDGYFDLAANVMETTGDQRSFDDAQHNSMPRVQWVGGSFEGHGVERNGYESNGSILTKYGKMGGRCAYDH